jgi:uncharacterized protein (DUF1501 family)
MSNQHISRRGFLVGCSAAIAGMAGARLGRVAFAADPAQTRSGPNDVLVVMFLRGGWDALSVLPPIDGPDRAIYEKARPRLKIPTSGDGAALKLAGPLGLHPNLKPLLDLYQARKLAIVQATGLKHNTRSHFDAMEYMELGTPGNRSTTSGWITRHLNSKPGNASVVVPAAGVHTQPTALLGLSRAIAVGNLHDMRLPDWDESWTLQQSLLRKYYGGDDWLSAAGKQTFSALELVNKAAPDDNYKPAGGATYANNELGNGLKSIARLIRADLGVQALSIDFGGWDTHEYQSDGAKGHLPELLGTLANGLNAFYTDLEAAGMAKRTTVVVLSEFGRRLSENESNGTDHGHGGAMFVLGGNVNGGKVFGTWPGLNDDQLFERTDLAITTDYRHVLSEIVGKRLGNPNIDQVFPGYKYEGGLGIV